MNLLIWDTHPHHVISVPASILTVLLTRNSSDMRGIDCESDEQDKGIMVDIHLLAAICECIIQCPIQMHPDSH